MLKVVRRERDRSDGIRVHERMGKGVGEEGEGQKGEILAQSIFKPWTWLLSLQDPSTLETYVLEPTHLTTEEQVGINQRSTHDKLQSLVIGCCIYLGTYIRKGTNGFEWPLRFTARRRKYPLKRHELWHPAQKLL